MSAEQLLREFETDGRVVICDLEAGVGTLLRLQPGQADVVLVVANPMAKSIDVARRAVETATSEGSRVIVVANRVRDEADVEAIRSALDGHDLVVVPDEPAIERADREGRAPIDVDAGAPGVRAILELAERLAERG